MENDLTQIVFSPTRNNNFLDLVLCRNTCNSVEAQICAPLETSDHEHINLSILYYINTQNKSASALKEIISDFEAADYESINNYLQNTNWFLSFFKNKQC